MSFASSASDSKPPQARERPVLWTVALAAMLVPLNSTMIAIGLPTVVDEFDTSLASASWLVTAYLIAMASLQPFGGRLGDRIGRRPLMLGGMAWFGLASAAAALAPSLELLIFFRVQQAVAGALFFPNAMALLRETVPPGRLGARMGQVGAVIMVGAAAGPPLGGALIAAGGWEWIFWINIPLVAVPLAVGWRHVVSPGRATASQGARGEGRPVRLLLRNRAFAGASAATALGNFAMYVTLLGLPVLLVRRGGFGSAEIGVLLGAMSAAGLVVTLLGGRLADRIGSRAPAVAGLSLQAASLVPLALAPAELSAAAVAGSMVIAGVGLGLSGSALQLAALSAVPTSSSGTASGIYSTSRYAGSITGSLLLAGPLAPAAAGTGGFGLLFAVLAIAALAAAAVASGSLAPRRGLAELEQRHAGRHLDLDELGPVAAERAA